VPTTHFIQGSIDSAGLWLVFFLVMLESAGIPLPGETALTTAALLAARGHFDIVEVIAVAAAAAIVGDNCGYWVGRKWGRQLLTRWKRVERFSQRVLPPSERFFARHGGKTVLIARFVAILRVTVAWLAGVNRMTWWRFLFWNAAGGVLWATAVGLLAFYAGKAAAEAFSRYGLFGAAAVIAVIVLLLVGLHVWRKRVVIEEG
jgi:membrane protein DedA with SNARE-associated domain